MEETNVRTQSILEKQLLACTESGVYPMHMPGHKRKMRTSPLLPYDTDITEVEGTDDLHHASGILREAMDRTARLYGSKRTWYLVNGSTCGILSAVRACTHFGGSVVAARNCHHSVYHAVELCGLHVRYIYPDVDSDTGLCGSIRPEQVSRAIARCPGCEAVILTSPTYEGVLSDIGGIAGICHAHDIPLIVDEAHGAHLGLFPDALFPEGALQRGADLVIQSPHKTLMSLTQTAWMHLGSERVNEERIEEQLAVFETSSPSYPLLTSLDGCACALRQHGEEIFNAWKKRLELFDREAAGLCRLRTLWHGDESGRQYANFYDTDPSKIVILGENGFRLARMLRKDFGIGTEMAFPSGVLAMTGPGDTEEGILRLAKALHALDDDDEFPEKAVFPSAAFRPPILCTALEAVSRDFAEADMEDAQGRVSAEYLYCYPPGIPILVPGEAVTKEVTDYLKEISKSGARVRRSRGDIEGRIFCVDE